MKIALVTGAYKGLGLEWCRQLGRDGYKVILTARRLEQAKTAAQLLSSEGLEIVPKAIDVAKEDQIASLAKDIASEFGQLDLVVNNAGINSKDDPDPAVLLKSKLLDELDGNEIIRHININSISPILMVKHFRKLLNNSEKPVVVSISSWLGSIGIKETNLANYSYSVSKTALNMLNRSLSIELKDEGIIAIVVNPGWVQTDMGSSRAHLTPEQSVRGVIDNVLSNITIEGSGNFYQWDGSIHPW
jgi:NAD(P)-dependent dehydrogenase (short-subunit alcohol dehydrogenase family)